MSWTWNSSNALVWKWPGASGLRQAKGSIRLRKKLVVSDSFEKPMLFDRSDESRSAGWVLPHQDDIPLPQCRDQLRVDALAFALYAGVSQHDRDRNI
jgi:hypothetical protein